MSNNTWTTVTGQTTTGGGAFGEGPFGEGPFGEGQGIAETWDTVNGIAGITWTTVTEG